MPSERRLHPFSIVFAFLAQIRAVIVPGLLVLVGASSRGGDWQPWMMLFVVPAAVAAVLRYVSYRYRYEPNEMVIRSGLVFRKERHIPYARIQNIDAVQRLLHRLLNIVEVRVETGGGQTPEATMSALPMAAFLEMRQRVFAERQAGLGVSDARQPLPAAALLQLNTRDLLLYGLIENRGAVVIAAAFGFIWELGLFDQGISATFGDELSGRGLIRDLVRGLAGNTIVTADRIGIALAALAGLLVFVRMLSMGWAVVRLHGFQVVLSADDLRSEYGLLTRVAATIPLRRIQTLTVRETPLHRLFRRVAVRAETAGGRASETGRSEREWLAPLIRGEALPDFVRQVRGGIDIDRVSWQRAAPGAFRREIKGWLILAALVLAGAVALVGVWALLLVPILLVWASVGARQTVRNLGWAVTNEAIVFRRGWLWRRVSVVRLAKIQVVTLLESPFDRRTAMARVRVDTAGASEASRIDIPYLLRETAHALRADLSHEAASRQFKW